MEVILPLYGYVSGQSIKTQTDALLKIGCKEVISDSSGHRRRDNLIKKLKGGDQIAVWRLDCLANNLIDLHQCIEIIKNKGVRLKALHEKLDTDKHSPDTLIKLAKFLLNHHQHHDKSS